jgi:hypothetical protein
MKIYQKHDAGNSISSKGGDGELSSDNENLTKRQAEMQLKIQAIV